MLYYQLRSYPISTKLVLVIWSVGFLIGTYTHTNHLVTHGLLHHKAPIALSVYWDTLTLLDPLTAALLWCKPKIGILLAVSIMASDISINTYHYLSGYAGQVTSGMVPLFLFDQALFGLFVFVTASLVWRQVRDIQLKSAS